MKRFLKLLSLTLALLPVLATAQPFNRANQKAQIDALLPSNNAGGITAAQLRTVLKAMVDSGYFALDDGTPLLPSAIGVTLQPLDADLTSLAGLNSTNVLAYRSADGTWSIVNIGSGLTFTGGTLSAAGGSGTVTSFSAGDLAPLFTTNETNTTTTPALTFTLSNASANTFFSGPTTGGPAVPGYRALVDADVPAAIARDSEVAAVVDDTAYDATSWNGVAGVAPSKNVVRDQFESFASSINSGTPNGSGAKVHWSQLTGMPAGFADGSDDGAGGGSGTVTSFSAGDLSPLFTTSEATPTTTPALTFTLTNAAQNTVFAGPATGGTGAPSYRALVDADVPAAIARDTEVTAAADAKVADAINDGTTDVAPSQNAVFDALAGKQAADADLDDLADGTLTGSKVQQQQSITSDASGLKLSGDSTSPGNSKLYGTNGSGVKGWYDQPSGSSVTRQTFSNAAVTVNTGTTLLAQTGTMTASRVVTMPAASAYTAGTGFVMIDESGTVNSTNPLVITRAGSDTINGATTFTVSTGYGYRVFISNGSNGWLVGKYLADEVQTLTSYVEGVTRVVDKVASGIAGTPIDVEFALANNVVLTIAGETKGSGGLQNGKVRVLALDSTQGGVQAAYRASALTSETVALVDEYVTLSNASAVTCNLPDATLATMLKRRYVLKNIGAGNVTVDPSGTQTIFTTSAVSTVTLTTGQSLTLIGNGANWIAFQHP